MSTTPEPDPFDELIIDESFAAGGPREESAEERVAKARRIARENDRLRAAGEISDGSGKPAYRRLRRSAPWILVGAIVAGTIVLLAVLAR